MTRNLLMLSRDLFVRNSGDFTVPPSSHGYFKGKRPLNPAYCSVLKSWFVSGMRNGRSQDKPY